MKDEKTKKSKKERFNITDLISFEILAMFLMSIGTIKFLATENIFWMLLVIAGAFGCLFLRIAYLNKLIRLIEN